MSSPIPVFIYSLLMCSLAIIVRWELRRRRKGPSLKSESLHRQIGNSRLPYSPPPDRLRRSLDPIRH